MTKGLSGNPSLKSISKTRLAFSYFSVGTIVKVLWCLQQLLAGAFFTGNSLHWMTRLQSTIFGRRCWASYRQLYSFVGIGTFLSGALPKLTIVLWIYLAASVLVKMFGPLLNLSDDVAKYFAFRLGGKSTDRECSYDCGNCLSCSFSYFDDCWTNRLQ